MGEARHSSIFPSAHSPSSASSARHSSVGILQPADLRNWTWAAAEATVAAGGRGRGSRCELAKDDRTRNRPRNRAQNPRPTQGPSTILPAARETGSHPLGLQMEQRDGTMTLFAACLPCACNYAAAVSLVLYPSSHSFAPSPYSCINHAFYSLCSNALASWGFADPEGLALPGRANSQ